MKTPIFKTLKKPFFPAAKLAKILLLTCTAALLWTLVVYPSEMLAAAAAGLQLWFHIVFPSLFPFMAGINLFIELGGAEIMGRFFSPIMKPIFNVPGIGAFPLVMGILSGYPSGAKITADLREKGLLTQTEAQRIMSFCNNPGPLFVLGTVAAGMLSRPAAGYCLMAAILLGSLTTGLLFRFYHTRERRSSFDASFHNRLQNSETKLKAGALLGGAVQNAMETIMQVGGFIILFSVITKALDVTGALDKIASFLPENISHSAAEGVIVGIIEMTNGAGAVSALPNESFRLKLLFLAFLLGFGGLSTLAQTVSFTGKTDIHSVTYAFSKAVGACFSGVYAFLLWPFFDALPANSAVVPASHMVSFTPTGRAAFAFLCLGIVGTAALFLGIAEKTQSVFALAAEKIRCAFPPKEKKKKASSLSKRNRR